jgi:hypothetical protein
MRGLKTLRTGDLTKALGISSKQESKLFTRLSKGRMIAQVRRGQRRRETIKIEISLREPLLQPAISHGAATILMNPLSQQSLIAPVRIICIAKREALAEKFRAAMTRREPAIRDYFDIDYAVRKGEIDPSEQIWLQMVRHKLAVLGNEPVAVSEERLKMLRSQLEPFLKPVLRIREFQEFDLDRAFKIVADVAAKAEISPA